MNLNEKVRELAEQSIHDDLHFIVEVKVTGKGRNQKILVIVDGDNGIDIDTCSSVSRNLSELLDKSSDLFPDSYTLEVSSPGADEPILFNRQYTKNLGRKLSVLTVEGTTVEGTLKAITESGITLQKIISKKKKNAAPEEIELAFSEIKKAQVVLDFNALKELEEKEPLPQGSEEESSEEDSEAE